MQTPGSQLNIYLYLYYMIRRNYDISDKLRVYSWNPPLYTKHLLGYIITWLPERSIFVGYKKKMYNPVVDQNEKKSSKNPTEV